MFKADSLNAKHGLESSRQDSLIKIAGEVVASPDPGRALKVWREKLGIKQVQLARALKLSPSVLSHYESGRRPSPGVMFVRKYIEALVAVDEAHGRVASRLLTPEKSSAILAISEFTRPISASALLAAVK